MKDLIGILAVVVAMFGYVPYLRDIARGKTRPHAVSWLIWSTLGAILFAAQISDGAGAGAWLMGLVTIMNILIFCLALARGERSISRPDAACLLAAVVAGVAWKVTNSPELSVILATVIDIIGFIPTFRKSRHRPFDETVALFGLVGSSFGLSLFALDNISIATTLNPAVMTVVNALMVAWLIYRRKVVHNSLNPVSVLSSS